MISKKIIVFLLVINFTIIAFGMFLIIKAGNFPEKVKNLVASEEISQSALQFNVENFHTQLEMWEYVYDPNEERLAAFDDHNAALYSDAASFISLVESNPDALYSGGELHAQKIISDLSQVREDWIYLLSVVESYRQTLESDASDFQIRQAKDSLDSAVFANENLFDRLEFNKEVSYFTAAQSEYKNKLNSDVDVLLGFYKMEIFTSSGIFIFEALIFYVFIFRIKKNLGKTK